jgi:hypothetical protein
MSLPTTTPQDPSASIQKMQATRPNLLKKIVIFGGAGLGVVLAVGGVIAWATDSAPTDSAANTSTSPISKSVSKFSGAFSVMTRSSQGALSLAMSKKRTIGGIVGAILVLCVFGAVLAVVLPPFLGHDSGRPQVISSPDNKPGEHSQPNAPSVENENKAKHDNSLSIGLGIGISLFVVIAAAIVISAFVHHKKKHEAFDKEQKLLINKRIQIALEQQNELQVRRNFVRQLFDHYVVFKEEHCILSDTKNSRSDAAAYTNNVTVKDTSNNTVYQLCCKENFSKVDVSNAIYLHNVRLENSKLAKGPNAAQVQVKMVVVKGELRDDTENILNISEYDHEELTLAECENIANEFQAGYVVRPKLSRRDTRNTDPDESDLTQSGE